MTEAIRAVKGQVPIRNVASFMVMVDRLIDRDPDLPGFGVCHGPSGYGKTFASIFAQNRTGAIRVEVGDSWTKKILVGAILRELGVARPRGRTLGEMAQEAIECLADDPRRPLIVDEADKLADKKMLELVRELQEHSGVPVVLIGEEQLPAKLLEVERVHNRVLDWSPALPSDLGDARKLASAAYPTLEIAEDLLAEIVRASDGRARRIVVNLRLVAEYAANRSLLFVDRAGFGGQLFTGAHPAPRPVRPFARGGSADGLAGAA